MTRLSGCLLALLTFAPLSPAAETAPAPRAKPVTTSPEPKLPLTGLAPAKPMLDACVYRYSVSTANSQCQDFVDQGLGMYYSYVWIEAARAFETAVQHDPECAYAWLMLSRSIEKWGRGTPRTGGLFATLGGTGFATLPERLTKPPADFALDMARKLTPRANHREQLLIQSRLQEKGLWPKTPPDQRRKKAQESLDELLTLYDDDQEGWFWRAQLGDGRHGKTPFYKALLRVNPVHPGANHELVHFYESIQRPGLGWPYAEGYIASSPGLPHAFHMQSHLAMRIGKWGPTTDWSWRAIELQKAYHEYQGVKPSEDHQFSHHLETLTRSLVHEGRFAEARQIKQEAEGYKYAYRPEWFRMALATGDWKEAKEIVEYYRKRNKADGAYYAALLYLEKGDVKRAGTEIETLRQQDQGKTKSRNRGGDNKLWEVQGLHLCRTGSGEAGLKLLKKAVDATKNNYSHHAWGGGAVLMEAWGYGALDAGNAVQAEEAFQEALAHDTGSVRGALGMWALCERLGRTEEADRYLKVARRCWSRADPADFERLKDLLAAKAASIARPTAAAGQE